MTERKCACNKLFSILVNLAGGAQQREIGFPISTDNASWGGTTK
ncbi:nitrogen fixation protein NifR [Staphylococcus aureus]|nr:nitrogen fixation protein NifR [Staphylococcus aureus]